MHFVIYAFSKKAALPRLYFTPEQSGHFICFVCALLSLFCIGKNPFFNLL